MPLLGLSHVAIKSRDLAATEKFYTRLLGMTKVERPEFSFPGIWLSMGDTMIHVYGGDPAKTSGGTYKYSQRQSPIDHIALSAKGFDEMLARVKKQRCKWRQNDVPEINLWQIFLLDPSGVLIELNFDTTKEPRGSKGPGKRNIYDAGKFYADALAAAATPIATCAVRTNQSNQQGEHHAIRGRREPSH
jgi:catechol 2,3-dioxygenase-like lactoylglutathione lyase family enzyme